MVEFDPDSNIDAAALARHRVESRVLSRGHDFASEN
jgi:hypothetical protein